MRSGTAHQSSQELVQALKFFAHVPHTGAHAYLRTGYVQRC